MNCVVLGSKSVEQSIGLRLLPRLATSMCRCNIILLSCPRAKFPEINRKLHANFYQNMEEQEASTHTRDKVDFPPIILSDITFLKRLSSTPVF